jgi:hypothetical protein
MKLLFIVFLNFIRAEITLAKIRELRAAAKRDAILAAALSAFRRPITTGCRWKGSRARRPSQPRRSAAISPWNGAF